MVVEPGRRSIETAASIKGLAGEIGLENLAIVGNKVRNESDREFIINNLPGFNFLGFIPYDKSVVEADQANKSPMDSSEDVKAAVLEIYRALLDTVEKAPVTG